MKKIIIFIFMLILVSSFVSATSHLNLGKFFVLGMYGNQMTIASTKSDTPEEIKINDLYEKCSAVFDEEVIIWESCKTACDYRNQCKEECFSTKERNGVERKIAMIKETSSLYLQLNIQIIKQVLPIDKQNQALPELNQIFSDYNACIDTMQYDPQEFYSIGCSFTPPYKYPEKYCEEIPKRLRTFEDKYNPFIIKPPKEETPLETKIVEQPVEKIKPKLVPITFGEPFKKLTFSKGQLEMLRDGKVEKITKNTEFKAGDIIHTGDDGRMDISTEDSSIKVSTDTTLEFKGLFLNLFFLNLYPTIY